MAYNCRAPMIFFFNAGDYLKLEPPSHQNEPTKLEPVIVKESLELPLSSVYLGVFLGSKGKHIKPLCSQYGVSMHLGEERQGKRRQFEYISGDTVKVTISCKAGDNADLEGFKEQLLKRANTVNQSRKEHQAHVSTSIP